MNAKVTFIFNEERNGWSETWYLKEYNNLREASVEAYQLAQFRAGLLAPGANLEAIRTSDDAVRGDSYLQTFYRTLKGGATSGDETADTAWNAWLISCRSDDLYRRSMWLRGLSDDWIVYNRDSNSFEINPQMRKQLDRFLGEAVRVKASIKALARDDATTPTKAITGMGALVGNTLSITVPAHGVPAIEKVTIFGCQGLPGIEKVNGVQSVRPTDANTLEILSQTFDAIPVYFGGGKLRRRIQAYYPITSMTPMRPGKRDTGRRFFVTRGRRSARRT